jgi:hypothetical protein
MKRYGEWRYTSPSLISALDGGEWSDSRPDRFTYEESAPGTHWIGGWVGPKAALDAANKKKSVPFREPQILGPPARSSSLLQVSYPGSLYQKC